MKFYRGNLPAGFSFDGARPVLALSQSLLPVGNGFPVGWGEDVSVVGSPGDDGYTAKVIAHWDVVPHQTISQTDLEVGVVAFHINGIDRVEIYLEGGTPVSARSMTYNNETGVYEYTAVVSASLLSSSGRNDGPIELRAIAYPANAGEPRVLDSLYLNSDVNGTLFTSEFWCAPDGNDSNPGTEASPKRQPLAAMQAARNLAGASSLADGVTIYLKAGTYTWGGPSGSALNTQDRWAKITRDPAATKSQVVFDTEYYEGFKTQLVHVSDVTFDDITLVTSAPGGGAAVWAENCDFVGSDPQSGNRVVTDGDWANGIFFTSCTATDYSNGFINSNVVRDCTSQGIGEDAHTGVKLLVNSFVDDLVQDPNSAQGFHSDLFQIYGASDVVRENYIIYGLKATNVDGQGLFFSNAEAVNNVAVVNTLIAKPYATTPSDPAFSQFLSPMNHVLLRNVSLPNSTLIFRTDTVTNMSIDSCLFWDVDADDGLGSPPPVGFVDDSWFSWCHFTNTDSLGQGEGSTDPSNGDPLLSDPANDDWTLQDQSPLKERADILWSPIDLIGTLRTVPDSIGAYK